MVNAPPAAAVESAQGEAAPRRSERLLQGRTRSRYASPPSPARRRQGRKRSRASSQEIHDQEIVGGSADDAGAEFNSATLFYLTAEEMLPYYKRLYKKRANMGLAWYHKNNPEDFYEFTSMALNDVYNFMDGGICYMHMNFKARNVTTRSEELFFAELALNNSVSDANGGYSTTTCSIVDDDCVGMLLPSIFFVVDILHIALLSRLIEQELYKKDLLGVKDDLPAERYDEKNCYACAEKIKHPTGVTYKGGHYAEDYFVD
ncbi:unnamed protein product [Urochloa decumbens]|uniref:DUF3615 domain-containing protein n=1 Tax=Urochloa decumbens TaxID=240449 RepID=A0ABC8Z3F1_9POAL